MELAFPTPQVALFTSGVPSAGLLLAFHLRSEAKGAPRSQFYLGDPAALRKHGITSPYKKKSSNKKLEKVNPMGFELTTHGLIFTFLTTEQILLCLFLGLSLVGFAKLYKALR